MAGIFGFLSKKDRQHVLTVNGVGGIVASDEEMVEGMRYAANDKTCEAWGLDEKTQFIDHETGRRTQLLSAWSNIPVTIFGDQRKQLTLKNVDAIAMSVTDEEITWKDDDRKKKSNGRLFIGIIAIILAISVCIPVLVQACK